jgi:hypothetical protein
MMKSHITIPTIEPNHTQILQVLLSTMMSYIPTVHFTTPENSVVDEDFTVEDQLDDDDYEEAWARYEYAEYLADF